MDPPRSNPARSASAASSAVFTRFPLCPKASPVPAWVVRNAGWAFSQVVDPVVEYLVWPTAICPLSVLSVASSNT